MSVTIQGNHPTCQAGEVFQATVWEWNPLHSILVLSIGETGLGLELELVLNELLKWGHNEYEEDEVEYGIKDQAACTRLANRIETITEDHLTAAGPKREVGFAVESPDPNFKITRAGTIRSQEEIDNGVEAISPYYITENRVMDFITFLRNCGGFTIK